MLVCMQSTTQRYNYIQSYQNLQNSGTEPWTICGCYSRLIDLKA